MSMFYTWIYLKSLEQKKELLINLKLYDIFTDIEFNPKKSINCQAYSAALFISLMKRGLLWNSLNHHNTFKEIMTGQPDWLNNTSYLKHHLI